MGAYMYPRAQLVFCFLFIMDHAIMLYKCGAHLRAYMHAV